MPYRLAPCDLGDPGWGDPWFPHGAFVASLAFWYGLVILMFFPLFLLPYHVEMIQCYHLLHELAHELVIRLSLQHVWHTPLLSSSAFPAPSLPASGLVVCLCAVVLGVFFPFLQFPLPSLRREKSGAQIVARVFPGVPT